MPGDPTFDDAGAPPDLNLHEVLSLAGRFPQRSGGAVELCPPVLDPNLSG